MSGALPLWSARRIIRRVYRNKPVNAPLGRAALTVMVFPLGRAALSHGVPLGMATQRLWGFPLGRAALKVMVFPPRQGSPEGRGASSRQGSPESHGVPLGRAALTLSLIHI